MTIMERTERIATLKRKKDYTHRMISPSKD